MIIGDVSRTLVYDYDNAVKRKTNDLFELVKWWLKDQGLREDLSELMGQPCEYFKPTIPCKIEDLYLWVWWHPESADFWIAQLRLRKAYLEQDDSGPGEDAIRTWDGSWRVF